MFTTSCYMKITINDQRMKVVDFLENIGYNHFYNKDCLLKEFPHIICLEQDAIHNGKYIDFYEDTPYYRTIKNSDFIDCGDNNELFLALAALRDDSDYMQWFCGKGWVRDSHNLLGAREEFVWWLCNARDQRERYEKGVLLHKATPDQLIEHFKK